MPPIHLLIKPASGSCNMRCRYCFYTDEMSHRETASYGRMSTEVLEAVVRRALTFAEGSVTFAFQGGEPTLVGLDYYRTLVSLCKEYNTKHLHIDYALQTNGLLIDEEWAAFLAENRFLVGLSLDGPAEIHDANRVDAAGKGTHARVMAAARLMKKHGVEFNILTVVTSQVARSGRKVWSFFDKNGFTWRQCIPCLDPLEGAAAPWALTADRYAEFLKTTFDAWYAGFAAGKPVSERSFDNWVGMLAGRPPESCGMSGVCSHQFVVEADGSVYPCDFYVLDELRLGNFVTDSLEAIEARRAELGFVEASHHIHEKCRSCRWVMLCRGGCRRHREPFVEGKPGLNRFCEAYQQFFPYAVERMQRLAARLR